MVTGEKRPIGVTSVRSRALIVIPTYNERENVRRLIPAIMAYPDFDVLVVDDNSPDGTAEGVRDAAAVYAGRVHLMVREAKQGLGTAYVAGFRWALERGYSHVFEMDADFSHHPAALPRLLRASRAADVVIGSRYVRGGRTVNWPWHRKLLSRCGSLYSRLVLGLDIRDLTGGFRCYRRHVLESIDLDAVSSTGYAFQIELAYRAAECGFRVVEVPITFAERRIGTSKMDPSIVAEAIVRVLQLRIEPLREARGVPALAPALLESISLRAKRTAK